MRILADTNVLLRFAEPTHANHFIAKQAIKRLRNTGNQIVIVPQCIYEFWNVSTRTSIANGLGKTPAEAESLIVEMWAFFEILRDERAIFEKWRSLVTEHQISGVKSYDARLAAAMLRHGISHLLTFNAGDFRRFSHVTILEPALVVAQ